MDSDRQFLLVVLVVIALLALFVVLPVIEYVLLSVVLAYVLYPVHVRLREYLGPFVSALALLATSIVVIVAPIAYVSWVFARDLRDIARGDSDIQLQVVETRIEEELGVEVDLAEELTRAAQETVNALFGSAADILSTAVQTFFGIALALFLVFYLLRDGDAFVAWLEDLSPLPMAETRGFFEKVNTMMWGSVIGHATAAVVQAIVAGAGFWLVGIDSVVFWTVVMAILGFLPLIGAFLVWAPASAYLFGIGQPQAGVFLFVYGAVVVSLVDNYVRPIVIDREAHLNPGIILIGVLGGLYTFGFAGLFFGPIVIGVLAATLEAITEEQIHEGLAVENPTEDEPLSEESEQTSGSPEGEDAPAG